MSARSGTVTGNRPTCIFAACLGLILTSCQGPGVLPDGQVSTMHSEGNRMRARLAVTPGTPPPLMYHPIEQCSFLEIRRPIAEPTRQGVIALSIKPVRDRFLVVVRRNQQTSSYLISSRGKLYDFNEIHPDTSDRITSETYSSAAEREANTLRAKGYSTHQINAFTLVVPEYSASSIAVGDTAATILRENGVVWGEYKFRGLTVWKNQVGGLFDLVATTRQQTKSRAVLAGFSIVDFSTMLPLFMVLDAGSVTILERLSCSR